MAETLHEGPPHAEGTPPSAVMTAGKAALFWVGKLDEVDRLFIEKGSIDRVLALLDTKPQRFLRDALTDLGRETDRFLATKDARRRKLTPNDVSDSLQEIAAAEPLQYRRTRGGSVVDWVPDQELSRRVVRLASAQAQRVRERNIRRGWRLGLAAALVAGSGWLLHRGSPPDAPPQPPPGTTQPFEGTRAAERATRTPLPTKTATPEPSPTPEPTAHSDWKTILDTYALPLEGVGSVGTPRIGFYVVEPGSIRDGQFEDFKKATISYAETYDLLLGGDAAQFDNNAAVLVRWETTGKVRVTVTDKGTPDFTGTQFVYDLGKGECRAIAAKGTNAGKLPTDEDGYPVINKTSFTPGDPNATCVATTFGRRQTVVVFEPDLSAKGDVRVLAAIFDP